MSEETTAHNEGVFLADCLLQDHWCFCFLSCLFGCLVGCLVGCFFVLLLFRERSRPRTAYPHLSLTIDFRHRLQNSVLSILVIPECLSVVISTVWSWCMDVYVQKHLCATHTYTYTCARTFINRFVPENSAQST